MEIINNNNKRTYIEENSKNKKIKSKVREFIKIY